MRALALALLLAGACASGPPPRPLPRHTCNGPLPDDELEVVRAVVRGDQALARTGPAMIEESTWLGGSARCIPAESAPLPLLRAADVPPVHSADDYWKWFSSAHRGFAAVVSVSRVNFAEDRKQASLFYSVGCGPFCGAGQVVRLVRDSADWIIVEWKVTVKR